MDLGADQPPEDYGNQIKLPAIASGPDAQAATDLQAVIQGCLRSYMSKRIQANKAQDMLLEIMKCQGWTNEVTAPGKRKGRRR